MSSLSELIISLTSIDMNFFSFIPEDKTLYYSTDDDFLLIFLRPCKFYPQSAFELIKRIADFRDKNLVLFHNLMPSDERDAFTNHNILNVLKTTDHKNRRVMIVQCGKTWDPTKVSSDQILRMLYLVHLLAIQEPETQVIIYLRMPLICECLMHSVLYVELSVITRQKKK